MLYQDFGDLSEWAWEDINRFNSDTDLMADDITQPDLKNYTSQNYTSQSELSDYDSETKKESWTEQDNDMLYKLAFRFNNQWEKVAIFFEGKSCESLKKRWNAIKRTHRAKDVWTSEEDEKLLKLREIYGTDYRIISKQFKYKSILKIKRRCRILSKQLESKLLADYSSMLSSNDKNPEEIIDSFFQEDSISTGASDDYDQYKESTDEEEPPAEPRKCTAHKGTMLKALTDKMNELERLFKDTSSQILKLAESYESRQSY